MIKNFTIKRVFQGRLFKGQEIMSEINKFLKENSIKAGLVSGIGAVKKAKIGYYVQDEKRYISHEFNEPMEILSLKGNVSIKDGEPLAHIHVVFSKEDFSCVGGHLYEAEVFAFEFEIVEFEGECFKREFDQETGLFLWRT